MLYTIPCKVDGRIANLNFFDSWRNPCICFCWLLIFFGKPEPCSCFQKMIGFRFFEDPFAWHIFSSKNRSRLWCEQNWAIWNWGYVKSLHNREGFKIPSLLGASWSYTPPRFRSAYLCCIFFQLQKISYNGYLLIWVGGLDSWDPLPKGIVSQGRPIQITNQWAPNQQPPILIPQKVFQSLDQLSEPLLAQARLRKSKHVKTWILWDDYRNLLITNFNMDPWGMIIPIYYRYLSKIISIKFNK